MLIYALLLFAALTPFWPAQDLGSLVNRNRVLLVFAPSDQDSRFTQQLKLLDHHAAALKERDLVLLVSVVGTRTATQSDTLRTLDSPYATAQASLQMRSRFRIQPDEFTIILIGKDGGEKLRQHTPITVEKLSSTIDSMPMRQDEMKDRQHK